MPCEFLSLEDLLDIVTALRIGPVRDLGLLNAAALRPQTTLMGQDAYPSTAAKAAALLESLAKNHALIDGNKRLGWAACSVFYLSTRSKSQKQFPTMMCTTLWSPSLPLA